MPTEQVYEKAKVTTTAKLVSGSIIKTSYSGKLDLLYIKNGNTGAPIHSETDIAVKKGNVSKEYEMPVVGPNEENYELKVLAKYGKKKEKSSVLGTYTVWPKEAKVTIKDKRTDEVMKLAKFEVEQDGRKKEYATDDTGKCTCPLKKSAYAITIKAPLELDTDSQNPKRVHTILIEQKQTAVFVAPDITDAAYKPATEGGDTAAGARQYVNMTTAKKGCDAKGSIVEFEVSNETKDNGLAGDKIYIKVVFTNVSKRNDPKPALLAPAQNIKASTDGKTVTGHVELTADGGTAKFKVQLGVAGGDQATVTCGYTKADPQDDKIVLVNWRKLGYQLRYAQMFQARLTQRTREDNSTYYDIPDAIQSVYKARLEKVFIEYVNIKSHVYPNPPNTAPCMIKKGFLENNNEATLLYVLDGSQNWAVGATPFDPAADKREIHITLCESALSSNGGPETPTHELTTADSYPRILPDKPLMFPYKTFTKADEVNFKFDGCNWTAAMDKVPDDKKNVKPTFAKTDATADLGDNKFSVSEATVGGAALTVTLTAPDTLPPTEKAKIKTYYEACFNDAKKLRQAQNKLNFVITGRAGNAQDNSQRGKVAAALQDIHTTSTKKILYHPGLDDDGNPRTGPMTDLTVQHYNVYFVHYTLPTRASVTDPLLPGDFVGPASETKCPINANFKADGTSSINGNAGSGSQLLVLKIDKPGPCAATVCHELGHSMGMTVMPQAGGSKTPTPPGLTTPKHVDNGGWYYKDKTASPWDNGYRNLHKGGHCSNGMPGDKKPDSKFSGWSPGATDDVCIMWGSGGAEDNRKKYCDDCTEVIKARDLTDIRGQWQGRAKG